MNRYSFDLLLPHSSNAVAFGIAVAIRRRFPSSPIIHRHGRAFFSRLIFTLFMFALLQFINAMQLVKICQLMAANSNQINNPTPADCPNFNAF